VSCSIKDNQKVFLDIQVHNLEGGIWLKSSFGFVVFVVVVIVVVVPNVDWDVQFS
jgi:hypothetical protein